MRTTVTIDDDLLTAAKALSVQQQVSLGRVISDLMRKGLKAQSHIDPGEGAFPVFSVPPDARPITLEAVKEAEDDL